MSKQAFNDALAHFQGLGKQFGISDQGLMLGGYVLASIFLQPEEQYFKEADSTADVDPTKSTKPIPIPKGPAIGDPTIPAPGDEQPNPKGPRLSDLMDNPNKQPPETPEDIAADWWKRKAVVRDKHIMGDFRGTVIGIHRSLDDVTVEFKREGATVRRFAHVEDLEEFHHDP